MIYMIFLPFQPVPFYSWPLLGAFLLTSVLPVVADKKNYTEFEIVVSMEKRS